MASPGEFGIKPHAPRRKSTNRKDVLEDELHTLLERIGAVQQELRDIADSEKNHYIKPGTLNPFIICVKSVITPSKLLLPTSNNNVNNHIFYESFATDIGMCFYRNKENKLSPLILDSTNNYLKCILSFLKHIEDITGSSIDRVVIRYNQTVDEATFVGKYHTDMNNVYNEKELTNERQLSIALTDDISPTEFLDDPKRGEVVGPEYTTRQSIKKSLQCTFRSAGSATYWQTGYVHRKPEQTTGVLRAMLLVQFRFKANTFAPTQISIDDFLTRIDDKSVKAQILLHTNNLKSKSMEEYDSDAHKLQEFLAINSWHNGRNSGREGLCSTLQNYKGGFLRRILSLAPASASVSRPAVTAVDKKTTIHRLSQLLIRRRRRV